MIIHQLTGGTKTTDIIAIAGMPGPGKKALAKKVYDDPSVVNFFDSRIWYCLDQDEGYREAFITIARYTGADVTRYPYMSVEDMQEHLYCYLWGTRYLLVIEGWCISAWDYLEKVFSGGHNGSRVLIIC